MTTIQHYLFIGGPFDHLNTVPDTVTHIHVTIHHRNAKEGMPDQPGMIERGFYERDDLGFMVWQRGNHLPLTDPESAIDRGISGLVALHQEEPDI